MKRNDASFYTFVLCILAMLDDRALKHFSFVMLYMQGKVWIKYERVTFEKSFYILKERCGKSNQGKFFEFNVMYCTLYKHVTFLKIDKFMAEPKIK